MLSYFVRAQTDCKKNHSFTMFAWPWSRGTIIQDQDVNVSKGSSRTAEYTHRCCCIKRKQLYVLKISRNMSRIFSSMWSVFRRHKATHRICQNCCLPNSRMSPSATEKGGKRGRLRACSECFPGYLPIFTSVDIWKAIIRNGKTGMSRFRSTKYTKKYVE